MKRKREETPEQNKKLNCNDFKYKLSLIIKDINNKTIINNTTTTTSNYNKTLYHLPLELIINIISFLDLNDRLNISIYYKCSNKQNWINFRQNLKLVSEYVVFPLNWIINDPELMKQVTMIHCNTNSEKFVNFTNTTTNNNLFHERISYLNLDFCNNIIDDIIKKYINLKQLSIVGVNNITDDCLVPLLKLERLNILNGFKIVKTNILQNIKYIKLNSSQIDIDPYQLFMSKHVELDFDDLKD